MIVIGGEGGAALTANGATSARHVDSHSVTVWNHAAANSAIATKTAKPVGTSVVGQRLVNTTVGYVSSTRSLQSPVSAQRLANVDFGERITTYLSR
jgi:hypothetical protein